MPLKAILSGQQAPCPLYTSHPNTHLPSSPPYYHTHPPGYGAGDPQGHFVGPAGPRAHSIPVTLIHTFPRRLLTTTPTLQGTGLVPLKAILSGQQGPVPAPVLLWRKWLMTTYSGVALAGTVLQTALEARRQKQGAQQQQPQLNATYVR